MQKLKQAISANSAFCCAIPGLLWQLLFLVIPLGAIIWMSIVGPDGITIRYFQHLMDVAHLRVLVRSIFYALTNATLCALAAYPIAYWLAFYVKRWHGLCLFLLTLPFWINFLLHVYSWFFVLERQGLVNMVLMKTGLISQPLHLINSGFAIGLVMFHAYLPFMILPLYSILEKIDRRLIDAALDLGARPTKAFCSVTLPLSLSGLKTGLFLVSVMSFGEFVIPTLMGGGKTLFVGTLIWQYIMIAQDFYQGAAFTCLSSVVLVVVLVCVSMLLSRMVRSGGGQ